MGYTTKVHHDNNGDDFIVESGGVLNVKSGGALKINGTALTPTAAEINALAGVTAGTITASKAAGCGG